MAEKGFLVWKVPYSRMSQQVVALWGVLLAALIFVEVYEEGRARTLWFMLYCLAIWIAVGLWQYISYYRIQKYLNDLYPKVWKDMSELRTNPFGIWKFILSPQKYGINDPVLDGLRRQLRTAVIVTIVVFIHIPILSMIRGWMKSVLAVGVSLTWFVAAR